MMKKYYAIFFFLFNVEHPGSYRLYIFIYIITPTADAIWTIFARAPLQNWLSRVVGAVRFAPAVYRHAAIARTVARKSFGYTRVGIVRRFRKQSKWKEQLGRNSIRLNYYHRTFGRQKSAYDIICIYISSFHRDPSSMTWRARRIIHRRYAIQSFIKRTTFDHTHTHTHYTTVVFKFFS